jgi:hypothetical protein
VTVRVADADNLFDLQTPRPLTHEGKEAQPGFPLFGRGDSDVNEPSRGFATDERARSSRDDKLMDAAESAHDTPRLFQRPTTFGQALTVENVGKLEREGNRRRHT